MATVTEKKAACGYTPKLIPSICGNCAHFASDRKLPDWMLEDNARRAAKPKWLYVTVDPYTVEKNGIEVGLRCTRHGFAVKKMGACNDWAPKKEGGAA